MYKLIIWILILLEFALFELQFLNKKAITIAKYTDRFCNVQYPVVHFYLHLLIKIPKFVSSWLLQFTHIDYMTNDTIEFPPFHVFNGKIKKICRNFWKHQHLSSIISWVSCQNVFSFWYFLGLWTAKETKIDKVTPVGKDRKLKCLLGQYIEPCWPDMGNLYIYKESRWVKSSTWPHERIK